MKKTLVLLCLLVSIALLGMGLLGCGGARQETPASETTTTTIPGYIPPSLGISVSNLFDVTGAKAVASASKASSSSAKGPRAMTETSELLKMDAAGKISSAFSSTFGYGYHQPISVIEKGPDGSLYVGLSWGIYLSTPGTMEGMTKQCAFFRIKPDGSTEVVDDSIVGMGSWYSSGMDYAELPVKQIQFDSAGNVYYLGRSGSMGSETTVLKKKTTSGVISQIGSSSMQVRDFVVIPSGFVLFHGSNAGSWSIEWLNVFYGSSAWRIFYNDMSSGGGYLRTYFIDKNSNVLLVGSSLNIQDKKYSGVIRVRLNPTNGEPTSVEALYDDNNMYSDTYTTIGSQLTWGYWDPALGTNRKFFATDVYSAIQLPLSLEAGVTEDSIRAFVRGKFQSIASDALDSVTFAGMTTSESWTVSNWLDGVVNANIFGTTWKAWKDANGLQNVAFGNARQILFAEDGSVYAVMHLDTWGGTTTKGDRIYRIVNAYGTPEIVAYPQDANYKTVKKAKYCGSYIVYLSEKSGYYKIFRLDPAVTDEAVDMTSAKGNIEIYSFNYNPVTNSLLYDVYEFATNTSYLAEQLLTSTFASETAATGYTIKDIVPFESTE